jgi:bifunctional DNA-binding transcriptional regulator/antitoxin component of YhaV-PrlF toxin-antitoxin module
MKRARQLVRLRDRNQITLPARVVDNFHLKPDDYLEFLWTPEGKLQLQPATIAAKGSREAAEGEERARQQLAAGDLPVLKTAEEFREYLRNLPDPEEREIVTSVRQQLHEVVKVATRAIQQLDEAPQLATARVAESKVDRRG